MTPLTEKEYQAFRLQKCFTLYEASMLWLEESPLTDNDEIINPNKPSGYYAICNALIEAIHEKKINPNDVKVVKFTSDDLNRQGLYYAQFSSAAWEEGMVTPIPDDDYGNYYGKIDPYSTTIKKQALVKWAALEDQLPKFLKKDIEKLEKAHGSLAKDDIEIKPLRSDQRHKQKNRLKYPDNNMTLKWIVDNVPVKFWIYLILSWITAFALGVVFAPFEPIKRAIVFFINKTM